MATVTQSPTTFTRNLGSRDPASDFLSSSSSGACGVPLKALGKAQFGIRKTGVTLTVNARKVKKHDYPWPKDPDPNVKGGVLSHLSYFKPLKEKPKPVTLEFEKPLLDLQKQIIDVQEMANETGLDFSDQIISLENKYQQALKDLYTHMTPIQRLQIARHPNRPTFLDHVLNITDKFVELHGDREGYDDPAIVTGLGTINDRNYMLIGHQKGRNTKENIQRNFGMPTPHGYRKALRMMLYADHHNFPIITFIDTPGAYADLKSEELGQGEAIARNLWTMFGLKVPIISIVIGEGGSGGALAIGCANKMLMLENSVFYVASPEACAAILWKSAKAAPKAAEKLKITAPELLKLQIADGIIPEPLGGAHADPYWTSQQIKEAIVKSMDELSKMDDEALLKHRHEKYRRIGGFQEGLPVEPEKKINMKQREVGLRDDNGKMKDAESDASATPEAALREQIKKLEEEIYDLHDESAKALGMEEKISSLFEEFDKESDQASQLALKEKIEQLRDEFERRLPSAPNYSRLKDKIARLKELRNALNRPVKITETDDLKHDINSKLNEILGRPDVQQKFENLIAVIQRAGVAPNSFVHDLNLGSGSLDAELNPELLERILQFDRDLDSEIKNALASEGLQAVRLDVVAKKRLESFKEEVNMIIGDVLKSSDLKAKVELLKAEAAKSGNEPVDGSSKAKIEALAAEIKQAVQEAVEGVELKEKCDKLMDEIVQATKTSSSTDDNGVASTATTIDGSPEYTTISPDHNSSIV